MNSFTKLAGPVAIIKITTGLSATLMAGSRYVQTDFVPDGRTPFGGNQGRIARLYGSAAVELVTPTGQLITRIAAGTLTNVAASRSPR